jgi:hypothetical protein
MAVCGAPTDENVGPTVPSGDLSVWVETTNRRWDRRLPHSSVMLDEIV